MWECVSRTAAFLCSCLRGAHGIACPRPVICLRTPASDRMKCISTQPDVLLYACVIYMSPKHTHIYTFSIHPRVQKQVCGVSGEERGWGKRLKSHLRHGAWGPTAQSPIPCSSMWKMAGEQEEEGKEAKNKCRKEEEGVTISRIC